MKNEQTLADKLGSIRSKIEELRAQEEEIRQLILQQGPCDLVGFKYIATVSAYERQSTDWKTVAEKLKPSAQLVRAHTKTSVVQSVRVTEK